MSKLYRSLFNNRRQQIVVELQQYKFFKVIETNKPISPSVYDTIRIRSDRFRDYEAFRESLQTALYDHSATDENDFVNWFGELTDDCRRLTVANKQKTALWHIFLTLARRIPATAAFLDCLTAIENLDDYTPAAYELFNTLEFENLIND